MGALGNQHAATSARCRQQRVGYKGHWRVGCHEATHPESQSVTPHVIERDLLLILLITKGELCLYHEEIWQTPRTLSHQPWPVNWRPYQVTWLPMRCHGKQCVLLPETFSPNLIIRKQSGESGLWGLRGDISTSEKTKAGTVLD